MTGTKEMAPDCLAAPGAKKITSGDVIGEIIPTNTYEVELARLLEECYPAFGTSDDAAILLGMTPAAMREFCRQGKIRAFKAGVVWRIPRPALLRFMLGGDRDASDSR